MEAKEFGEFLREARTNKKLTIRQLELYSSVSNAYISQMERGLKDIPSPEILKKLSKPLGISYEELMEKAGYITKEQLLRAAVDEGIITIEENSDDFTRKVFKMIMEDTDLFIESLNEHKDKNFKDEFLSQLFDNPSLSEFLINAILSKKNITAEQTKEIIKEIDELSESEIDDVIDFIKYKKSKSKDR